MFEGLRRARNREHLLWHLQQMASLEEARDEWEREGRYDRALAANYELVSHASRALVALRKLEELKETLKAEGVGKYRQYLLAVSSLPSIAQRDLRVTPSDEVMRAYSAYREYITWCPESTLDHFALDRG